MGNSTQLLDWHLEDPVSNDEILRHNLTCSMFQFNRNPFIDFPSLLEDPDVLEDLIDDTYCSNPCVSDDDDAANDDTTSTGEYDLNPGFSQQTIGCFVFSPIISPLFSFLFF